MQKRAPAARKRELSTPLATGAHQTPARTPEVVTRSTRNRTTGPAPAQPQARQVAPGEGGPGFNELPLTVLEQVHGCVPDRVAWSRMSETCRGLSEFVMARLALKDGLFRLGGPSRGANVPPASVVRRLARLAKLPGVLSAVDLSGYEALTAAAAGDLAKALVQQSMAGEGLRTLVLRGCKLLTDAAIKRLLLGTPRLRHLNLLDIPRLSSEALNASLPQLEVLAAGCLAKQAVAGTREERGNPHWLATSTSVSMLGDKVKAAPAKAVPGAMKLTSFALARLAGAGSRPAAGGPEEGAPLSHLILLHCPEVNSLPAPLLGPRLRHLDLRGSGLEPPKGTVPQQGWRPLLDCTNLEVLLLADCVALTPWALRSVLESLPPAARLRALDLGGTSSDVQVYYALTTLAPLAHLTHLSMAGTSLGNKGLATILYSLRALQVLDVSKCRALQHPLLGIVQMVRGEGRELPPVRVLLVGQTDLANYIENTRAAAPSTMRVVASSADLSGRYEEIPIKLL